MKLDILIGIAHRIFKMKVKVDILMGSTKNYKLKMNLDNYQLIIIFMRIIMLIDSAQNSKMKLKLDISVNSTRIAN